MTEFPDTDPIERVPSESYVPDGLAEEERTMAERSAPARTLDTYSLREPVRDLALPKPLTVGPEATLREAVAIMQQSSIGCVLVVERDVVTGIFTERDLLLKIAGRRLDWDTQQVRDFMTPNPETLPETANLAFALNMMTAGGFRHVPIVDKAGRAICVVSIRDVVAWICRFFEKEVENLPPRPDLLHPEMREGL